MFIFAPQEQNVYSFLTTKHRAPTSAMCLCDGAIDMLLLRSKPKTAAWNLRFLNRSRLFPRRGCRFLSRRWCRRSRGAGLPGLLQLVFLLLLQQVFRSEERRV